MPSDPSSELCRREKKLSWFKRLKHSLISFLRSEESFEESLTELIEEHESYGNKVSHEEKEMLQNIINYGDLKVNDVMVPRSEVKALPDTATLDDFKELLLKKTHTRIPIYHENLDNVKGFVNVKDLLPWIYRRDQLKWDIDKLIREIFIVSPSMKLIDLLVKMKQSRIHIAIIVDEYGCTDGLVTFEDLVEEIVGEIEDEFDENKDSDMIKIREDVFVVNAREDIEKIESYCGISLNYDGEKGDYDSIGGLIMHVLGRLPKKGEQLFFSSGVSVEIIDCNPRRINKVIIRKGIE
jgi:magnesium and cobalt transporter